MMGRFRQFYEGLEMEAVGIKPPVLSTRKRFSNFAPVDQHAILSIKQRLVRELADLRREINEHDPAPAPTPLLLAIDQLDTCLKNLDLLLAE